MYDVTVDREDGQWTAQAVDFPEALDFASNLRALKSGMIDAIILAADLPDDATVELRFLPGKTLDDVLTRALELSETRRILHVQEQELLDATKENVTLLLREGYSVRDVAALTGITHGRVSQLVA